jgi:glutamyl-tRNA synthetase
MRGRFAPTPSGDLHLGGARTALCAWLQVRALGGTLVMRVEDLDRPRAVPGAEQRILDDLRWLGLDWDEGPMRQSERTAIYQAAVAKLLAEGSAFECFCSRTDVARAAQAPHPGEEGPRYPGTCRALSEAERAERKKTRPPSVRLKVEPETVHFDDGVHGALAEDVSATIGDFVLRRADGIFAYQLAVVVDDAEMQISDVLRGDDLRSSTARQLLLYRALGQPPPRFAHVPLVLGPDGARLAKRHGAISIDALRASGTTARQIIGQLAASLGLCAKGVALAPGELVAGFSLDRLPRSPTVLDSAH